MTDTRTILITGATDGLGRALAAAAKPPVKAAVKPATVVGPVREPARLIVEEVTATTARTPRLRAAS